MQRYIARRILLFIPTMLLGTLLIFTVMRILPGDIAEMILGENVSQTNAELNQQRLQDLRDTLGLDQPLPVQYGKWLWSMVNGEFGGKTLISRLSIRDELAMRYPRTVELAVMASLLSLTLGIPAGVVAAIKQDKWQDYLIRIILVGGLSLPSFWLALMMLLALLLLFGYTPPISYINFKDDPWGNLQINMLPAFILGFHAATGIARQTRAQILEVLRQDYIRTARSKGLMERVVLWRHAMKNAMIPVVTVAGLSLVTLFGGTVILESIFGIPGIGSALINGVQSRDYPLVQSMVTFFLFITMVGNLLVDISYGWLDPRIKYS